jgi:hypothetical protein
MQARRTLVLSQNGAKKFIGHYGEQLVCVHYRYDNQRRKRFTTVEIIIEKSFWQPPAKAIQDGEIVGLHVGVREIDSQRQVKMAGGKLNLWRRV